MGTRIVVMCANHAKEFHQTDSEQDNDGVHTMIKQYFSAECGCKIEVTLTLPNSPANA